MTKTEFEEKMKQLLPDIDSKAMLYWHLRAEDITESSSICLEEFYEWTFAEFALVKKHFDKDTAKKLFNYSPDFVFDPKEIRGAADFFQKTSNLVKFQKKL